MLSALDGTVVFAGYAMDYGYIIQVQHVQNFITIYKNCGSLMKQVGDRVKGGEVIALTGNRTTSALSRICILNCGTKGRLSIRLNISFFRLMKKQIAILGSTGSIGTQALQVIEEHPDLYEVYALTANNKADLLAEQARKFHPEVVVIANEDRYLQLKEALEDLPVKVYAGNDALSQVVEAGPIDIVLTAMVGYAGLRPTINAIKAGKQSRLPIRKR